MRLLSEHTRLFRCTAALAFVVMAATAAYAQQWPNRPIKRSLRTQG